MEKEINNSFSVGPSLAQDGQEASLPENVLFHSNESILYATNLFQEIQKEGYSWKDSMQLSELAFVSQSLRKKVKDENFYQKIVELFHETSDVFLNAEVG